MSIDKVAQAFCAGGSASCHNAITSDGVYFLHGNLSAEWKGNTVHLHWCDWYSHTIANHMNKILKAVGSDVRVSYARARDAGTTTVVVEV
jgi:hypothetical protein